jgi:serine/threonine-protein kinase
MTSSLDRLATALGDRYRIERELGAGGMATVFLAADLKHDRKVAIKVLKPELAAVLGAERFVQEIKTTAALSHPHILPLFDSGEAGGFLYYVMPYIEGETIREKLNRESQFGIDEAVRIATEVADALDYAHRHGVIHRDIKPENILLHDGRPMVMDFGIALAVSAAAGGRMTETGLSLGTPHYMSPEQATADKAITARSDIYSLASVLYEMLTGEPPHMGTSAQQIIMKIIAEPVQSVTALRKRVPSHVAAALATALEKLPADRFATAQDFATALANPLYATRASAALTGDGQLGARDRRLTVALSAALAVVSALALWLSTRPGAPPAPSSRYALALPTATSLTTNFGSTMAVSADGSVLVFAGADTTGVQRLWVKRAGEVDAAPVAGTDGGFSPFLSPDGTELGFFRAGSQRLIVVALAGGRPSTVTGTPIGVSGAYWATDGYIYFDADEAGIERIRPDGSGRESVAALDSASQVTGYAWPEVLPGNRVLVARRRRANDQPDDFEIVAIPIGGGPVVTLDKGVAARHLDGHLLVVRADGVIVARRLTDGGFGLDTARTILATGARVRHENFGAGDVATDRHGSLYYVNATASGGSGLRPMWLGSDGGPSPADSAGTLDANVITFLPAPGIRRAAVIDPTGLWVRELPSGVMFPIEIPVSQVRAIGWSPAGDSLLVSVQRERGTEILRVRADGLGEYDVIARDTGSIVGEISVSPDHRWLIAGRRTDPGARHEMVALDRLRDSVFRELLPGQGGVGPVLSRDGRWLAYSSTRSGNPDVYVRPFPDVNGAIWRISTDGGEWPVWSPDGDRIYYLRQAGEDVLFSVDVASSPSFRPSAPRVILRQQDLTELEIVPGWGVAPGGERLLVLSRLARYSRPQLVRVENATRQLARSPR